MEVSNCARFFDMAIGKKNMEEMYRDRKMKAYANGYGIVKGKSQGGKLIYSIKNGIMKKNFRRRMIYGL